MSHFIKLRRVLDNEIVVVNASAVRDHGCVNVLESVDDIASLLIPPKPALPPAIEAGRVGIADVMKRCTELEKRLTEVETTARLLAEWVAQIPVVKHIPQRGPNWGGVHFDVTSHRKATDNETGGV